MSRRGQAKEEAGAKPSVLPILERYGGKRSQQLLAVAAAIQLAQPAYKWAKERLEPEDYTIVVDGTDEVYPLLHQWILERIPTDDRKALIGDTVREAPRVRLRYDGTRTQVVKLDGHRVEIEVTKEELPGGASQLPDNWRRLLEKVKFTTQSPEGRDAIVRMLEELAETRYEKKGPPALLMPSRWGGDWTQRGDLPSRKLESVVLKKGQLERLVADLERFMAAEDTYVELSQSWHRGYLFHGIPGTGKTSVARALADHLELPVYYLPLGDMETDANLMGLIGQIRPRSMLLIEDIDVYHAAVERDEEANKASLAGMLNALDGVWAPHGLITVMTTNNREALDEALIRKGRIDVEEGFTALDADQARRLGRFCGVRYSKAQIDAFVGQSPAELMENAKTRRTT